MIAPRNEALTWADIEDKAIIDALIQDEELLGSEGWRQFNERNLLGQYLTTLAGNESSDA